MIVCARLGRRLITAGRFALFARTRVRTSYLCARGVRRAEAPGFEPTEARTLYLPRGEDKGEFLRGARSREDEAVSEVEAAAGALAIPSWPPLRGSHIGRDHQFEYVTNGTLCNG